MLLVPFVPMKRRSFLTTSAGAAIGSVLLPSIHGEEQTITAKKPLRVAHLTDIHIKPGSVPEAGFAKALHHAQLQKPGIDFMINGGDAIMDALEKDKVAVEEQWKLFHRILKNDNQLPVYHCIGNHDIWGWFIKENKPENDPLYGKAWPLQALGLKNRYYSFSKGKWHFIVLDSTQFNPLGGYIGKLDQEQLEWLQEDLGKVPIDKFICVVSHIPLLSICAGLFFNKTEANGDLLVKRNLMHTDYMQLKKIFLKHPGIRACISGHIHLQDELEYLGITYYCNGAVSGNWWNGKFQEFSPAYAIMEFYEDGNTKRTMVNY